MPNPIRFVLALHNHQPIGNFDYVFERAYQDSYLPFLDVFSRYDSLKISLHTSGSLIEWLEAKHPEYIDRLAALVDAGRIEILGGAFFEPILAMISSRDRLGQIRSYTHHLESRFGTPIRGMWVPERVWEQSFTADLVDAGIEYTLLDDFHFKNAGLTESQLHGYYLTEDEGRVMSVFPGNERLRYLIPFGQTHETVDYLAQVAEEHAGAVCVFGDDGEKFGTWPDTHKHVYGDGWLESFFDLLVQNQDWIQMVTLSEAIDQVRPLGKIYLPDAAYREMTEWALPAERQVEFDRLTREMQHDPHWPALKGFVRGGFWRNFKVRYPESNEMYSRMMYVSRRVEEAESAGSEPELVDRARTELYRAQCNCGYWHGAFGGIYLPHLRDAVYERLIAAEELLDRAAGRPATWIEATTDDYNFDNHKEIQLANDKLTALIAPAQGGCLYGLDVRAVRRNLLATLTRQPEAYHRKLLDPDAQSDDACASIHDRVVSKQEGLDQRIQYDPYPRKSLLDLFYQEGATLEAVAAGQAAPCADCVERTYEARLRRNPDRVQVQLSTEADAFGLPVRITKAVTLSAGSSTLEITYLLEGLPQDRPLEFAVEFNFAGMPSGLDDRFFQDLEGNRLGQLGTQLDLPDLQNLALVDGWLGLEAGFKISRPTRFWTFPVETVSQSEGGFELVHQSVVVQPRWRVTPDTEDRWAVNIHLHLDTSRTQNHLQKSEAVATT